MCYSPILVKKIGDTLKDGRYVHENIWAGCGKCAPCKLKRVNDWIFRLMIEDKNNLGNYFITLTYDTKHVNITKHGFMTLHKPDLQAYIARLKKLNEYPIKYYAVGEYGEKKSRPHYHLIVFGILEEKSIWEAWMDEENTPIGDVQIGAVQTESVAYTCKYIDKEAKIPVHARDDRQKEFSLMSKGIGKDYLSDAIIDYHSDYLRNSTYKNNGFDRPLPRYFRQILWTDEQRQEQRLDHQMIHDNREDEKEKNFYKKFPNGDYQKHLDNERRSAENARQVKLRLKSRNKV